MTTKVTTMMRRTMKTMKTTRSTDATNKRKTTMTNHSRRRCTESFTGSAARGVYATNVTGKQKHKSTNRTVIFL